MSVSFDDSIKVFLQKSVRVNLVLYAENVEEFLLKKYLAQGYSEEQIYKMKLGALASHQEIEPKRKTMVKYRKCN